MPDDEAEPSPATASAARKAERQGELQTAIAIWRRVADAEPDSVEAFAHLGKLLIKASRQEDAEEALAKAVALGSADPNTLIAWARLADDRGEVDNALSRWRVAATVVTEQSPLFGKALLGLGRALFEAGHFSEAADALQQVERADPGAPNIQARLVRALEKSGRLDEAIVLRTRLASTDEPQALLSLAKTLLKASQHSRAEEICERLVGMNAANAPEAASLLLRSLRTRGRIQEGLATADALLERLGFRADLFGEKLRLVRLSGDPSLNEAVVQQLGAAYRRESISDEGFADLLTLAGEPLAAARTLSESGGSPSAIARLYFENGRYEAAQRAIGPSAIDDALTQSLEAIAAYCGRHGIDFTEEGFLPGAVLQSLLAQTPVYAAPPRADGCKSVLFIAHHLAMGGFGRQVLNTVRGLRQRYGSDATLNLFLDSLEHERGHDFYLEEARRLGLNVISSADLAGIQPLVERLSQPLAAALLDMPPELQRACSTDQIWLYVTAMQATQPDIVDFHTEPMVDAIAGIASILFGPRRILIRHGNPAPPWVLQANIPSDELRNRIELRRRVTKELLRFDSVRLTNNSRYGIADLAAWLDAPEERFGLLFNGVDFADLAMSPGFDRNRLRREIGIGEDAFVIGSVMRLTWQKDPILWLEVAARFHQSFPQGHFVVVGDGPLRGQIEEKAVELGLEHALHMVGSVREDIGSHYRMMDVFLLTSRSEGMPNVAIEAQFCGLPVVLPDVAGNRECLLPGQTGWLVQPGDRDGYHEALTRLASDERLRRRAAEFGPIAMKGTFSVDRLIEVTVDLYDWTDPS